MKNPRCSDGRINTKGMNYVDVLVDDIKIKDNPEFIKNQCKTDTTTNDLAILFLKGKLSQKPDEKLTDEASKKACMLHGHFPGNDQDLMKFTQVRIFMNNYSKDVLFGFFA